MTSAQIAPLPRRTSFAGTALRRAMRWLYALAVGTILLASLAGCACRPGYVGPYGGVHPGRCWVW